MYFTRFQIRSFSLYITADVFYLHIHSWNVHARLALHDILGEGRVGFGVHTAIRRKSECHNCLQWEDRSGRVNTVAIRSQVVMAGNPTYVNMIIKEPLEVQKPDSWTWTFGFSPHYYIVLVVFTTGT